MQRESKFELLRIISMCMIIAYHYVGHGIGINNLSLVSPINRFFLQEFFMFGKIGVNLFVMLTGYFGIKTTSINKDKLLKLSIQTTFFQYFGIVLFIILGNNIEIKSLITFLFPIIFNKYWFITAYVVMFLLSPYINRGLMTLSKKEYQNLILLLLVIWCFIPTFSNQLYSGFNWTQQIWMIVTYIFGAYIRLYPPKLKSITILVCLSIVLLLGSVIVISIIARFIYSKATPYITYFCWSNSILAVFCTFMLFIFFVNLKISHNNMINRLGTSALSVYLFHENQLLSPILWQKLIGKLDTTKNYIITLIITIIIIYFIGFLLHNVFEFLYVKLVEPKIEIILKKEKDI